MSLIGILVDNPMGLGQEIFRQKIVSITPPPGYNMKAPPLSGTQSRGCVINCKYLRATTDLLVGRRLCLYIVGPVGEMIMD